MISLARHIELLLLEHDCVIIPGIGGFIANHADAKHEDGDEHLFFPPYRTIGFNQQLQVNDGLLVQSYMAAYDTSYPFANLQMEKDLEKMMYELDMTGEYELENIGVIRKGLNQNITFTAPETGPLTPSLYGLYSFEMKPVQSLIKEREIEKNLQAAATSMAIASVPAQKTRKRKEVIIRLNRHWVDFGISVAAAVVLFFCFSYPAMRNVTTETDTVVAAFNPMEDVTAIKTTTLTARPNVAKPATTTKQVTKTVKPTMMVPSSPSTPTPASAKKESGVSTPKYAIVLASYVSQQNAETFLKNLEKGGYTEGRFVKNGKVSRILYSDYNSEAEAQQALSTLRKENAAFVEAWVLAL